ncbi:MAG: hypothetical protein WCG80_13940 [Spirochaetales bacterium]
MRRFLALGLALCSLAVVPLAADVAGENNVLAAEFDLWGMALNTWGATGEFALGPDVALEGSFTFSPNLLWLTGLSTLDSKLLFRAYFGRYAPWQLDPAWSFLKGTGLTGLSFALGPTFHWWSGTSTVSGVKGQWTYLTAGLEAQFGTKYFLTEHWFTGVKLGMEAQFPSSWGLTANGVAVADRTTWTTPGLVPLPLTCAVGLGYAW